MFSGIPIIRFGMTAGRNTNFLSTTDPPEDDLYP